MSSIRINDGIENIKHRAASFLMVGQSNMAGRGDFGEVPEIRNPLCYMLRMGRWQPMSEPINPDRAVFGIRYHSGVSLAASFADSYSKHFSAPCGLIPCADGGTKITDWMPDSLLFEHAVMQCRLAEKTSDIKAVLWHQGESDCQQREDLEAYEKRLIYVISELRKALNKPEIPIIMGEISDNITDAWKMENRNIEFNKRLPDIAAKIPRCAVAPAKELAIKDDGIHFTSQSCRELGRRYFDEYLKIM